MEKDKLKNLLTQVRAISERYQKINELTGENFNVFRILKLESSEVRMHSAFIAELLNPKGSHGQKDVFLKLFIKRFCFRNVEIDIENCIVEIEKHVGFISDDKVTGGRLDIVITDKNKHQIIIENKIYAGDQNNQLVRYHQYSSNADIVYLTLDGKLPSDSSKGALLVDVNFKCFSYEKDILSWLEDCRKEVPIYPTVREAITHYINLIKHLTNQTLNKNMENEIISLLSNEIESSWNIINNWSKARQKIAEEFFLNLKDDLVKLGFVCDCDINLSTRFSGLYVWKPDWNNIYISFQFQRFDTRMFYGFLREDPEKFEINKNLESQLRALPNNTGNGSLWWPWYSEIEHPYGNWTTLEALASAKNGRMKDLLFGKMQMLFKLVEGFDF